MCRTDRRFSSFCTICALVSACVCVRCHASSMCVCEVSRSSQLFLFHQTARRELWCDKKTVTFLLSDLVLQLGQQQGQGQRLLWQPGSCSLHHNAGQRCQPAVHLLKGRLKKETPVSVTLRLSTLNNASVTNTMIFISRKRRFSLSPS